MVTAEKKAAGKPRAPRQPSQQNEDANPGGFASEAGIVKPDLRGFALGDPAPRDVFQVYATGVASTDLQLSGVMPDGARGYQAVVEGDTVTVAIADLLGLDVPDSARRTL